MTNFSLELFLQIIGVGSASGLIYDDHSLLIIGDNSGFLYEYQIDNANLNHYALIENPTANIPKPVKPDFESMAADDENIYVFGSGSKENRNIMITLDRKTKAIKSTTDLTNLHLAMQSFGDIKSKNFNIEGVIHKDDTWYFFQRGNNDKGKSGIFTVNAKNLDGEFSMLYNEFKLPKIKGVKSGFTDAVLIDNDIYFLAAAENVDSAYDDGKVFGSLFGKINLETMALGKTEIISENLKLEGMTLFEKSENGLTFLLCEDNDTAIMESGIYKLTIAF